jgi:hypothetical protein
MKRPGEIVKFIGTKAGRGHHPRCGRHWSSGHQHYEWQSRSRQPITGLTLKPSVFQPGKLYYLARSRKLMKFMIKLMPLFGRDPHKFGRNGDIDLTKMTNGENPVHAVVRLTKQSVETRNTAVACHPSQSSGPGTRPGLFKVMEFLQKLQGPRESFTRAYPPPTHHREKDLFEGLE